MLRIKDLPRGGGAEGGGQMWFELLVDNGQTYTFSLASEQVEAFIAGLRTFQLEAFALASKSGGGTRQPAFLHADRFQVEQGPAGELRLTLGTPATGQIRAAVPRRRVKELLAAVVATLATAVPPTPPSR